jgi:hypothetical protein
MAVLIACAQAHLLLSKLMGDSTGEGLTATGSNALVTQVHVKALGSASGVAGEGHGGGEEQ